MAQLEKDSTVNYAFGELISRCVKVRKKASASLRPRLGSLTCHKNFIGIFRIKLCSLHSRQVLRLPAAVSPDYTDSFRCGRY